MPYWRYWQEQKRIRQKREDNKHLREVLRLIAEADATEHWPSRRYLLLKADDHARGLPEKMIVYLEQNYPRTVGF